MQVLTWLALVAIFIFFIVKINNLLKRIEELKNNVGKQSDLKLVLHRLRELEKEIQRPKGADKRTNLWSPHPMRRFLLKKKNCPIAIDGFGFFERCSSQSGIQLKSMK
jgi:hypothetical protein